MKIGITPKDPHFSYLWGFTNSDDCVDVDIRLPGEVENSLRLSQTALGSTGIVPIAHLDEGSHGIDAGLVFIDSAYEKLALRYGNNLGSEINTWEVSTRISFGPTRETQGHARTKETANHWNGNLGRLHLTVRGSRIANPRIDSFRGDTDKDLIFEREQVNFSMRWLDGKFDDWNSFSLWEKDADSNHLGHYRFDEVRTTYFMTDTYTGTNSNDPLARGRQLVAIGPRKSILPQQPKFADVVGHFKKLPAQKVANIFGIYHGGTPDEVPMVGYAPTLEVLAKYGNVSQRDARRIPKMTPQEGAQYMFEKVLPAMLAYTRTR